MNRKPECVFVWHFLLVWLPPLGDREWYSRKVNVMYLSTHIPSLCPRKSLAAYKWNLPEYLHTFFPRKCLSSQCYTIFNKIFLKQGNRTYVCANRGHSPTMKNKLKGILCFTQRFQWTYFWQKLADRVVRWVETLTSRGCKHGMYSMVLFEI